MRAYPRVLSVLCLTLTLVSAVSCKTSSKSDSGPAATADWKVDMHHLSESLSTLLPLTLDPLQFNNPANQPLIDRELTRLARFSHAIGYMPVKPSEDPALAFVANEFSADMGEAQRQLRMGNRAYARHLISNATSYCISCHTQVHGGPQFEFKAGEPFARLGSLERANYLLAVRSFDEGIKEFDQAMKSPDVALQPYPALEATTLRALAVAVRVKRDPKMAQSVVEQILNSKWAPVYLQMAATQWKVGIQDWQKSAPIKTLADVRGLLAKGWKRQMESPMSRAGLIEFLRASATLHDLLKEKKPGKAYAETLYVAGLTSEALKELDLPSLSEYYFESCIRHLPHSDSARNCYVRLETETIGNYNQFDNGPLPGIVRDRLSVLKELAADKDRGWKSWTRER